MQEDSKILLCNSSDGKLFLRLSLSYNKLLSRAKNPVKDTQWSSSRKIANGLTTLTISAKKAPPQMVN